MRLLAFGGLIIFVVSFVLKMAFFQKWLYLILLLAIVAHLVLSHLTVQREVTLKRAGTLALLTNIAFFLALTAGSFASLVSLGSILVIAGILSNELVVRANGMKMPVKDDNYIDPRLKTAEEHVRTDDNTKLPWLGDCIPVPGELASIGDLVIISGLYLAIIGLWLR